MNAEIQNICGTFISKKIHQPFGRFGSTVTIIRGPSSVQLVQGRQNDFLGYRERDCSSFQLVSSQGYGDWRGNSSLMLSFRWCSHFRLHQVPDKILRWQRSLGWNPSHPICCCTQANHLAQRLSPSTVTSKVTQVQNTGFCQPV